MRAGRKSTKELCLGSRKLLRVWMSGHVSWGRVDLGMTCVKPSSCWSEPLALPGPTLSETRFYPLSARASDFTLASHEQGGDKSQSASWGHALLPSSWEAPGSLARPGFPQISVGCVPSPLFQKLCKIVLSERRVCFGASWGTRRKTNSRWSLIAQLSHLDQWQRYTPSEPEDAGTTGA